MSLVTCAFQDSDKDVKLILFSMFLSEHFSFIQHYFIKLIVTGLRCTFIVG